MEDTLHTVLLWMNSAGILGLVIKAVFDHASAMALEAAVAGALEVGTHLVGGGSPQSRRKILEKWRVLSSAAATLRPTSRPDRRSEVSWGHGTEAP
jgi:hypothetical protein